MCRVYLNGDISVVEADTGITPNGMAFSSDWTKFWIFPKTKYSRNDFSRIYTKNPEGYCNQG